MRGYGVRVIQVCMSLNDCYTCCHYNLDSVGPCRKREEKKKRKNKKETGPLISLEPGVPPGKDAPAGEGGVMTKKKN